MPTLRPGLVKLCHGCISTSFPCAIHAEPQEDWNSHAQMGGFVGAPVLFSHCSDNSRRGKAQKALVALLESQDSCCVISV